MTQSKFLRWAAGAVLLASSAASAQIAQVDPSVKRYAKASGVSGNLSSVGSDTMNNLMTLWAEGFKRIYPNVKIQIEGKGSSTAPPALISGTAQIGPMSRAMKPSEIDGFEKAFGYKPTMIKAAVDGLAVFVHRDNTIDKLTLQQVDAIFSKTRSGGYAKDVRTWGDLGLTGEWAAKPISLYGRNSASGTYGYFKEHALFKGDFRDTVKEQPGSAAVVQGITEDRFAIGYSGVGYRTSGVKTVAIAAKEGAPYVTDDPANVLSGKYPLARFLYVYVNKAPNKPLDPMVREMLRYVLSREGQEVIVKDGYLPLPPKVIEEELRKLD